MNQKKEFINGLFVKRGTEPFIKIGVLKKEFIKQIEAMETDEKGFFNLTMAPQKNDPSKYSVWVDNWKPTKGAGKKAVETTDDHELPF
jgi:hypothetical protein